MSIEDVARGLTILASYDVDISAEHDIIYIASCTVKYEEYDKLIELGFQFDNADNSWYYYV